MTNYEQRLKKLFQASQTSLETHEPDIEVLAAFVDGALKPRERQQMLTHLSDCEACRKLVIAASEEVSQPVVVAKPKRRPWWQLNWWVPALAGTAAAAAAVLIFIQPEQDKPAGWFHTAPSLAFADVWQNTSGNTYRSIGTDVVIAPLSPRWSVAESLTPKLTWKSNSNQPLHNAEILIIDENQALVTSWKPMEVAGKTVWPDTLPALEPDRTYAWKISYWTEDRPHTSIFVPFRTPSEQISSPTANQNLQQQLQNFITSGQFGKAFSLCLQRQAELPEQTYQAMINELSQRMHLSPGEQALLGIKL